MAVLVTDAEVRSVMGLAASDTTDMTLFITTADLIVTESLKGHGYSPERLKMIELYLAAHFASASIERGGLKSQTVGLSTEEYQATQMDGIGLAMSRFGQIALQLDKDGLLAPMATKGLKAQIRVYG